MTGSMTWDQVGWLAGVLVFVVGTTAALVWRFSEHLKQHRHDIVSRFEQRFVVFDERMEAIDKAHDARLHAIEMHNAGLAVVLKQMDINQQRMQLEFRELREERKEDMKSLHDRFAQLDGRFDQMIRGVKYIMPDPIPPRE